LRPAGRPLSSAGFLYVNEDLLGAQAAAQPVR
jgi:hypothetical protein